jgi:hypothetical protein
MMLGIFLIPMPAYLLESSIYCILFTEWELRMITWAYCILEVQSVAIITLISNPHLVVDHTFMVILLTIPIIILFCDGKMGNYSGITLEYCYFIN